MNHLLVVDDESALRTLLYVLLTSKGFDVTTAGSGEEALEIYRQNPHKVGLVLLDVKMPGLDGPQTLTALRAIDPAVCCCFLSGNLGEYTVQDLKDMGGQHVFLKPIIDLEAFIRQLRQILSGQQFQR
jgi:CheY-like chemotaxis protein